MLPRSLHDLGTLACIESRSCPPQLAGPQAAAPFARSHGPCTQSSTRPGMGKMPAQGRPEPVHAADPQGSDRVAGDSAGGAEVNGSRETWMVLEYCDKGSLQVC